MDIDDEGYQVASSSTSNSQYTTTIKHSLDVNIHISYSKSVKKRDSDLTSTTSCTSMRSYSIFSDNSGRSISAGTLPLRLTEATSIMSRQQGIFMPTSEQQHIVAAS